MVRLAIPSPTTLALVQPRPYHRDFARYKTQRHRQARRPATNRGKPSAIYLRPSAFAEARKPSLINLTKLGIETVLSRRQPLINNRLDGIGGQRHLNIHVSTLSGGHSGQHPVSWILVPRRSSNTYPHPNKIAGTHMSSNGLQPIVAVVSASLFEAQPTRIKICLLYTSPSPRDS